MGNNNSMNNPSKSAIKEERRKYNIGIFDLFEDINKYCLELSNRYKELLYQLKIINLWLYISKILLKNYLWES